MKCIKKQRKQRLGDGLGRKHGDFFISHHAAVMNYEQFAQRQHSIKEATPVGAGAGATSKKSRERHQPSSGFIRRLGASPPATFQPTDPELQIHTFLMNDEYEKGAQSSSERGELYVGMIQPPHHP